MKKEIVQELVTGTLALLFLYAGISKMMDMPGFRAGMKAQPFAGWLNALLADTLPFLETAIAAGLWFGISRKWSLYAYTLLMVCFTVYTGLVVFGFFKHRPCGCGGIISRLSWTGHFIINLIFLTLSCYAIYLQQPAQIFMHKQGVSRKPGTE